jgi:hypothetical protein
MRSNTRGVRPNAVGMMMFKTLSLAQMQKEASSKGPKPRCKWKLCKFPNHLFGTRVAHSNQRSRYPDEFKTSLFLPSFDWESVLLVSFVEKTWAESDAGSTARCEARVC